MKPMWPGEITHPILAGWLRGTTCHNYWIGRSELFENADYIVLKHNSHASYSGRFSDNGACKSYAALYRKSDLEPDVTGYNRNLFNGDGYLKRWEGRIARTRVLEDCRDMGILFESTQTSSLSEAHGVINQEKTWMR